MENNSQILIGKSDIYNIPTQSPNSPLTLFGNPNFTVSNDIYGASQRYNVGCLNVSFNQPISPTPTPTNTVTPTKTTTNTPTKTSTPTPTPTCARPIGGLQILGFKRYFINSTLVNLGALNYTQSCNNYKTTFQSATSFDDPIPMYIYPGLSLGTNVAKVYSSGGTSCSCPGSLPSKYWVNLLNPSIEPTTSSGVYWMSVDSQCNVTLSACTAPNAISVIGSFNLSNNPYDISSDSASLRYYSYSQDGTEILDSKYKDVDSLSFSAFSGNTISKVLFDSSNFKMYFGSLGNDFIDVYDIVGLSTSQIDLSSYNVSVWDMTLDVNNGVLGVINGEQSPNGKVIFISTLTDTVYGQFTGTSGGYRGAITNDLAGYAATVSLNEDLIRIYNSTIPLSALTIPISANTGGYRSLIYNQTNGYYYVLNFGESLEWVDPNVGSLDSVSLSGYSGSNVNSAMIYSPPNDRIYILNVKSNGNYGIITVDCSTNTIINFTDDLLIGGGIGAYEGGLYLDIITSPNELLLWTKTNKTVYRLNIS